MSDYDPERDRIAPHINEIEHDLRGMIQTIERHIQQIEKHHEYVRLEGAGVRVAIGGLRGALDRLSVIF